MNDANPSVSGRNGVVIQKKSLRSADGFRTYEVHQRERVGESTHLLKPIQLVSDEYRVDPYPLLKTLRENYPFYRDWLGNRYWLTPYNDVTSVYADDANFETRSKCFFYGLEGFGRNLGEYLPVLEAEARTMREGTVPLVHRLVTRFAADSAADLARQFAAPFASELLCDMLALEDAARAQFTKLFWQAQRGAGWRSDLQSEGRRAIDALVALFEPLVAARRAAPGEDMLSAMVGLDPEGGPVQAEDVVTTLLERDHETLHGALANLWFLLLTHPGEFEKVRSDRRVMKIAYLETLRHSTPVLSANRFARHEVERFGKLIPQGALVVCSAAAANRDATVFEAPDQFIADRADICHREPRGQYRADGLASGIAFGLGKPSRHPAVPEDRPPSRYALTRDTVVDASMQLVEMLDDMTCSDDHAHLRALTAGEMHTCWRLPVRFRAK